MYECYRFINECDSVRSIRNFMIRKLYKIRIEIRYILDLDDPITD